MAIAGLVLGFVGVVLGVIFILAIFFIGKSAQDQFDRSEYCFDQRDRAADPGSTPPMG